MTTELPELKKLQATGNDIDSIIDMLISIQAQHGNLPCYMSGMEPIEECTLYVGDTNYNKEECPKGYVVMGQWAC